MKVPNDTTRQLVHEASPCLTAASQSKNLAPKIFLPLSLATVFGISYTGFQQEAQAKESKDAIPPLIQPSSIAYATFTAGIPAINQTYNTSATNAFVSAAITTTPGRLNIEKEDALGNQINLTDTYTTTFTVAGAGSSKVTIYSLDLTANTNLKWTFNNTIIDSMTLTGSSAFGALIVGENNENDRTQAAVYAMNSVNLEVAKTIIPDYLGLAIGINMSNYAMLPAYTIDGVKFEALQPYITPWSRLDFLNGKVSLGCYPGLYLTNKPTPALFGTCNISASYEPKEIERSLEALTQ